MSNAPKKPAPLPRLKPGAYTAYDVLAFVRRVVQAQPRRLWMRHWLSAWRGQLYVLMGKRLPLPECGTVACLAGWINIVTRPTADYGTEANSGSRALAALDLEGSEEGAALYGLFSRASLSSARALSALSTFMKTNQPALRKATIQIKPLAEAQSVTTEQRDGRTKQTKRIVIFMSDRGSGARGTPPSE